jgi:hypothetical protein
VRFAPFALVLALALIGAGCRSGPAPAIDPAAASAIPPGAEILAGIDLSRLRASPLHQQIPPAAAAFLEPFRDADSLLAALGGRDYVVVARGSFRQPPPGYTLLAPGLAAAGSPAWLSAAAAQYRSRSTGAPVLLERAEPLAAASAAWIVAAGNATLPVSGNAGNLNRLLRLTQFATLSVHLGNGIALDAVGMCDTPDSARHLEETVRAFATIGAAASARRQPAAAALLSSMRITREDRAVHLDLQGQPSDLEQLLKLF